MIFVVTIVAYVIGFGLTTFIIAPVQSFFLPEITVFASLMYLPHGIRVLATWAMGWRAIPALFIANLASAALFVSDSSLAFLEPGHTISVLIGASSAFVAFEVLRVAGINLYYGGNRRIDWKGLIGVGILASIFNSIGNAFAYSQLIELSDRLPVLIVYLLGDVVGLIGCLIALMLVFRWQRLRDIAKREHGRS